MSAFSHENVVSGAVDANITNPSIAVTGSVSVNNLPVTQPVSGTVSVDNFPASTGLTDTQLRATPVPISGTVNTTPVVSASSIVSQITSNASNQVLLASNANRKKAILFFSSGIWDVKLGSGATATSRTLRVSTGSYLYEISAYTGPIEAICTTSGKIVDVTELI